MHKGSVRRLSAVLWFLCTLSCEVPMHDREGRGRRRDADVSMHSLVRGAYAPTAHWPSSWPTSVSMHSLVRGAYAPEPTPTPEPTPVSMHSLVRGAYAPSAARRRSLTSRFYALSRARCLCTFPHRVVIRHVAGFLCTLSCEVPMHSADATTLDVWFLFLCTLSCEVPMHRSHLSRHGK